MVYFYCPGVSLSLCHLHLHRLSQLDQEDCSSDYLCLCLYLCFAVMVHSHSHLIVDWGSQIMYHYLVMVSVVVVVS
jgi:hypothetical protein